ncbi:MAG: DUF2073 domain-containing protein [Methanoregulaceae archaeon]|jgi:uncharacterized protein|nr:DUF2073 domain-containing protein [Methanoregulaceae archaeon]
MQQGVQINLISEERLSRLTSMEKIHLILDDVREGTIVILEKGLDPDEQSKLIEMTMLEILPDGFNGIEIETYPSHEETPGFLRRLLGQRSPARLTVIGPANQLRMIRKDKDVISAWVSTR